MYITKEKPADMQVNILGSDYTITFKTEKEDVRLIECDGYCDSTINTIVVKWLEWDSMNHNNMLAYVNKVITHEIIHGFLYQSGLDVNSHKEWARNEEMVDWFAIQLKKINEACFNVETTFIKNNKDNIVTEEDVK